MSFIDRILSIFRGSNGTTSHTTTATARTTTDSSATNNPYKIHTVVRIDALSFSNDYRTLYLIDAGKLVTFPLDTPSGLIIGTLLGRLTFAAQLRQEPVSLTDDGTPEMKFLKSAIQPQSPQRFAAASPNAAEATTAAETQFKLEFGKAPVWAPHYLPEEDVLAIVGMSDVVGVFQGTPDAEIPEVLPLPSKDNLIKIFLRDKELLITSQRGRLGPPEIAS